MFFSTTIDMAGDTRHRVVVSVPGAILNVVLSAYLGRRLGLYGVTLATVVAYMLGEAWYSPYLFCHRYGVSGRAVVRESSRAIAVATPWALAVWYAVRLGGGAERWITLAAEFAAASLLTLAYVWFLVLHRDDRVAWRVRIAAMLRN
jgi:O-antigen/teichoic acid export membrane protein